MIIKSSEVFSKIPLYLPCPFLAFSSFSSLPLSSPTLCTYAPSHLRLAHCLHVEEVNAMHHQSHREQSMALEELLSGPRVGTKESDTADGDRDRDGLRTKGNSEEMEGRVTDSGDDSRCEKEKEEESGLGQGTAQVAVLSFARITQVRCFSYPSLNQCPIFYLPFFLIFNPSLLALPASVLHLLPPLPLIPPIRLSSSFLTLTLPSSLPTLPPLRLVRVRIFLL
jgi:hypothetical protein